MAGPATGWVRYHAIRPEQDAMITLQPRRFAGAAALLLLLAAGATGPVAAQSRDRWQVTLADGRIEWDVRLVRLDGDSLRLSRADSAFAVPVAGITEVRLIRKSEVQLGGGFTAGAMNALTGADDEIYDLTPLEFADRVKALQKLFVYHPPE